ncbi:MAG: hypothetical protein HYS32_01280 [Candidatus Woesearchaeota archaeon]|nr:MAG: hypothetical protein HYS32_01280 [Candidatus Woesearchaeota archaeon]
MAKIINEFKVEYSPEDLLNLAGATENNGSLNKREKLAQLDIIEKRLEAIIRESSAQVEKPKRRDRETWATSRGATENLGDFQGILEEIREITQRVRATR